LLTLSTALSIMLKFVLLCALLLPTSLIAGAWPRGKYNGYLDLSFFHYFADDNSTTSHFYGEFGITDRITLALDGIYQQQEGTITGVISVLYALPEGTLPVRLAFGGGIGQALFYSTITEDVFEFREGRRIQIAQTITQNVTTQHVAQFSAHMGYSTNSSWMTADLRYLTYQSSGEYLAKLDLTYGRHLSPSLSGQFQVQIGQATNFTYLNLAPAVEWPMNKNFGIILGGLYDTKGDRHALRLGVVLKF